MKITSNKPDENQSYKNNFKENGVYPFSKITRVITDKKTGQILQALNENDSGFDRDFKKSIFDETKHDIMCMFPKFYYRRNWEDEELEDCIVTDIPPEHINLIPESISDKSFEVFPCFVREDGSIRDYVLYSAFEGSIVDGQLRSIPNEEVVVNKTLEEFRGFARSDRDKKFNLENMSVIAMIQFLYKIGFQDLNSQKVLGKGWVKKQSKTKTGGTLKLGNRSGYLDPFANSPDKPDDRISLSFRAGENGELAMYNAKGTDPMPIKTRNMTGLQKWEETDDYIIYLDKDAVMTTVVNYVTGTYDLFKERKADIDGAMELLRDNDIEWTAEDDSKLLLDINKAQLERIANTPTTMEEDAVPQTFTTRAVPTTYECCFRVDKNTGEIYIGDGYENLFNETTSLEIRNVSKTFDKNGILEIKRTTETTDIYSFVRTSPQFDVDNRLPRPSEVWFSIEKVTVSDLVQYSRRGAILNFEKNFSSVVNNNENTFYLGVNLRKEAIIGEIFKVKIQITKTSTPKPFVKSIMPNGKLAFVTNATSETHSFVGKGVKSNLELGASTYIYVCGSDLSYERSTVGNNFEGDCLISKNFNNVSFVGSPGVTQGQVRLTTVKWNKDYFTQLLIYKGNLTEAELKAENEKDIIADNQIDNNEYPPQYNSNSLFGIENFYGNAKRLVDGFIAKDVGYYYTAHPNKMGQTSAYEKLPSQVITGGSNGVEGWSKKIDKQLGVFNIPSELNEQKDAVGVVTRGLIEHFDFADGKGTETTLKSRVSDNVLTLSGFNFDQNSGWTGKGLKFDGVKDWCDVGLSEDETYKTVVIDFQENLKGESFIYFTGATTSSYENVNAISVGTTTVYASDVERGVHMARDLEPRRRNNVTFIKNSKELSLYLNDVFCEKKEVSNLNTKKTRPVMLGKASLISSAGRYARCVINSIKIYNVALTPEEITQNYEYEQSIDRTTISTYPLLQEQKSYGIGLSNQLSEEQKTTFRLSIDRTKFVAGLRYCEGLEVEEFTYSEIQVEMEKEEWSKIEEVAMDTAIIEQNTEIQSLPSKTVLTSKSDTKTSEETHYTDYFISHAPNKENIAIFGSDFEAEEKAGVFTLDLNKEIDHKDDRTSARLVILP